MSFKITLEMSSRRDIRRRIVRNPRKKRNLGILPVETPDIKMPEIGVVKRPIRHKPLRGNQRNNHKSISNRKRGPGFI